MTELPPLPLLDGLHSRQIPIATGLDMHVIAAGKPTDPLILFLHGFPELAFSWRKIMPAIAELGFHCVAPDQRGYGRTTGADVAYDTDTDAFGMMQLVRDAMALMHAMDHDAVHIVVGHDFGSPVAAWCAIIRPDLFPRVVMMSAPFEGPPGLTPPVASPVYDPDIHQTMADLERPRKHYQWYYGTSEAERDMRDCAQGLHEFMRAYYHVKSADWPGNEPYLLSGWTADQLALMPTYYIMDLAEDMAETVAPHMPADAHITASSWLPDEDLSVYVAEYARTGFQGGLNWYRSAIDPTYRDKLALFAGKQITVPSLFIAGAQDWGIHQKPGALERMQTQACTDMRRCHLINGAGHWVQQEQPAMTLEHLKDFIEATSP